MRGTRLLVVVGVVALAVGAGCVGSDPDADTDPGEAASLDHDAIQAEIGEPIEMFHDHTDPSLHNGSHNLEIVAYSDLGVDVGEDGNGFADFQFHEEDGEELAVVAIDGDDEGGFNIVDVSDPQTMETIGTYRIAGSGIQEAVWSPSGDYVLVNVQTTPPTGPGASDCQVCIHVVDVSDRSNPELVSRFPVDLLGTHNIELETVDGETWVFYTGQPFGSDPAGNYVGIARLVETPAGAHLAKVAEYRHTDTYQQQNVSSFPHDTFIEEHPVTGDLTMYASWWDGGAITVDVSDPAAPVEQDKVRQWAPSEELSIHQFRPEPNARGQQVFGYSAPEIGQLDNGSGVVRSYDLTDPANFEQVGSWQLPGNVTIPGQYLMSPHVVSPHPDQPLAAVGHYHAGVWVLDTSDPANPEHVAFNERTGGPGELFDGDYWWKKPNFDPEGYMPNIFRVTWHDDMIWVTERGSGLYVYDYTGPTPGDGEADPAPAAAR
jgi:hypothetical protein